jgi:hypothetical protein
MFCLVMIPAWDATENSGRTWSTEGPAGMRFSHLRPALATAACDALGGEFDVTPIGKTGAIDSSVVTRKIRRSY